MPRDGAIIFSDLIDKLDVLRVLDEITADCPKKSAQNWNDQCAARCPDLAVVIQNLVYRLKCPSNGEMRR